MAQKRQHNHESKKLQAELVRAIVSDKYEPGRQDRCKSAIYRNLIKPRVGICERTFWRYMNEDETKPVEDARQLKLF